uniref:Prealbumin-like fold domain-containing protein n=1 Tax=Anolis carolinensis TaxID=28377 RepID=A0A803TL17_ANOCA
MAAPGLVGLCWLLLWGGPWATVGASEDIVVGCGGFVKSSVEINYSLIEIKLYTKHGTLKYQTDCAPNNGYFMIPLYDKDYTFSLLIDPTSVDIHVDGISDICTRGGDIDFVFTGFSVNGKVLSKGQTLGPAGVLVSLRHPGSEINIQATATHPGGKYAFFKVLPGEYEIFASHPTWVLEEVSAAETFPNYFKSPNIFRTAIFYLIRPSVSFLLQGPIREPEPGLLLISFSFNFVKELSMQCFVVPAVSSITLCFKSTKRIPLRIINLNVVLYYYFSSVGPLHSDREYTVSAQKEGFVLSAVEGTVGDFKAFALAGISFEIKSEDGHPLAGVLLSLSGGVFRSNLLTQENGMLTFSNLSPGQYYFKPMMKEFRFEPSSQMIEVQEGQNLKIDVTGYRTAYSCYGTVSSLNGEPEQGVSVEAVGQGQCNMYGEDTITDEEGKFRLRGLLPSCVYYIQLKAEGNDHIERALPQHSAIEIGSNDIENVNIIAFRQINQFDLSGNVITSSEHLPTLWVKLYKSENLDNPVHTVSLGQSLFFHFPPLLRDGENYVVLLDSTLSKSQYDYILPQISFSTVGYHKHITLVFNPMRKLPEQDIAQGSYIALPLTLLLLLAGYNHDKLIPLLLQLTSRLQGVRSLGQAGSDAAGLEDAKRQAKKQKTRRTWF